MGRDGPMRRVPGRPAVFNQNRLWGFVMYLEALGDRVRQEAIFDYEYHAADYFAGRLCKTRELLVHVATDRALRAMLENKNGIGFRPFEKFFKISILAQLDYHIFRVTDSAPVAEK